MYIKFQPPYDRAAYLGTKKSKSTPAMLPSETICQTSGNRSTNGMFVKVNVHEGLPEIAQKTVDLASTAVHQKPVQKSEDMTRSNEAPLREAREAYEGLCADKPEMGAAYQENEGIISTDINQYQYPQDLSDTAASDGLPAETRSLEGLNTLSHSASPSPHAIQASCHETPGRAVQATCSFGSPTGEDKRDLDSGESEGMEWEAEHIIGQRTIHKKIFYMVRWKPSLAPPENIQNTDELIKVWEEEKTKAFDKDCHLLPDADEGVKSGSGSKNQGDGPAKEDATIIKWPAKRIIGQEYIGREVLYLVDWEPTLEPPENVGEDHIRTWKETQPSPKISNKLRSGVKKRQVRGKRPSVRKN